MLTWCHLTGIWIHLVSLALFSTSKLANAKVFRINKLQLKLKSSHLLKFIITYCVFFDIFLDFGQQWVWEGMMFWPPNTPHFNYWSLLHWQWLFCHQWSSQLKQLLDSATDGFTVSSYQWNWTKTKFLHILNNSTYKTKNDKFTLIIVFIPTVEN